MAPTPRRPRRHPADLPEFGRMWWVPPLDTAVCRWCEAAWWRLAGGTIFLCPTCDRRPRHYGD